MRKKIVLLSLFSSLILGTTMSANAETDEYFDMAVKAVEYIQEDLVMPDSLNLAKVSYTSSDLHEGMILYKIKFSAKNKYGGEIDTSLYFEFDEETKDLSDSYQLYIDWVEAKSNYDSASKAYSMLTSGDFSSEEEDLTTIYIKNKYSYASDDVDFDYKLNDDSAIEIDCEDIMDKID